MLSYARERGQGLVEYAFIILLVVLVVIAYYLAWPDRRKHVQHGKQ